MPWIYESTQINPNNDSRLLVRVLIGKTSEPAMVEQSLKKVPVIHNDPTFNCVRRVRLAVAQLELDGIMGKGDRLGWAKIWETALNYVAEKKRQGRFEVSWKGDTSRVATYDLLLDREIVCTMIKIFGCHIHRSKHHSVSKWLTLRLSSPLGTSNSFTLPFIL